jgi:hypothetical protein
MEVAAERKEGNVKIKKIFSILAVLLMLMPVAFAQSKPPAKSVWKTYRAENGSETIEAKMDDIRLRPDLETWASHMRPGVQVWAQLMGVDTVASPMFFDCNGHFMWPTHNHGFFNNGWMMIPSKSIADKIAKDVCAKR